jgi:hypothetical protein
MGAPRESRRSSWFLAIALGVVLGFVLHAIEMPARAGTQQCNTECQSKMTDCILACDGIRSCEEACKKKGQSCVAVCTSDAGPSPLPDHDAALDSSLDRERDGRVVTAKDAPPRAARRDR